MLLLDALWKTLASTGMLMELEGWCQRRVMHQNYVSVVLSPGLLSQAGVCLLSLNIDHQAEALTPLWRLPIPYTYHQAPLHSANMCLSLPQCTVWVGLSVHLSTPLPHLP